MVKFEVIEKLVDGIEEARDIHLLLVSSEYKEDIEKMCYYDITGDRAVKLYNLTKGDVNLVHQSIKFIESGLIPLKKIHKNLDSKNAKPLINRSIKKDESYEEFFKKQIEECWKTKKR